MTAVSESWVNGLPEGGVSVADRGLQYGDGLFETITCVDGCPRWLPRHLARLQRGCERLSLPFIDWAVLSAELAAAAEGQERCILKLLLTRGVARRRGYRPAGDEAPTRILMRHAWPEQSAQAVDGFRVALSAVRLGHNELLAGLKHLNRLEQVLAQLALDPAVLDEVLMLASTGEVISGSMSNVFFVDRDGLLTPSLERCGVAGVMRERVCTVAQRAGLPVRVRAIDSSELDGIQEAFLTNVRWGVQPIGWLDGRALSRRHWARRVRGWLDASPD